MKKIGLIGYPLGHSFSKKYFTEKFHIESIKDWQYDLYPIEKIEDLPRLLKAHPDLCGLNVTIPYKQAIMPYLSSLQTDVKEIGAANTVKIEYSEGGNPILTGYNTDAYGFRESLLPLLKPHHKNALVLGTGGSSKAVRYVLENIGITATLVSRDAQKGITYDLLSPEIVKEHKLIINCTPLGMYPNIETAPPIPYSFLDAMHLCYDLVYNPEDTLFIKRAAQQGAMIKNGLEMLYLQAEKSWEIFCMRNL